MLLHSSGLLIILAIVFIRDFKGNLIILQFVFNVESRSFPNAPLQLANAASQSFLLLEKLRLEYQLIEICFYVLLYRLLLSRSLSEYNITLLVCNVILQYWRFWRWREYWRFWRWREY